MPSALSPRRTAAICLLAIPACALANGAMGLGLEIWNPEYWVAYCVAMVLLETWLINRMANLPLLKALAIAIGANFVTGIAGGPFGCCAVLLHPGSTDLNAVLRSFTVLAIFAVPSALIEGILWTRFVVFEARSKLLGWIIAVHLITIPIGWLVLIIPEYPYKGMEATVNGSRRRGLLDISKAAGYHLNDKNKLPNAVNPKSLVSELEDYSGERPLEVKSLYRARYQRFSTGEDYQWPFHINRTIAGKSPESISKLTKKKLLAYATSDVFEGHVYGLFYDVEGEQIFFKVIYFDDSSVDWTLR